MKGVNRVTLVGCLGHDPEVKDTGKIKIAKFSLATNSGFKDDKGEWQEQTEWHNVVLWGRLADLGGRYLRKGSKVYIEGHLRTTSWEDRKAQQRRYKTEIVAHEVILLGDGQKSNGPVDHPDGSPSAVAAAEGVNGEIPF